MVLNKSLFSSNNDDWETPNTLFNSIDRQYHFVADLAASPKNAKCKQFFAKSDNALLQDWSQYSGSKWLNPPYGRQIGKWVKKAYESSKENSDPIVMLLPARTDTRYWHDYIFGKASVEFIKGRIKFEHDGASIGTAPFPSAIIVYNSKSGCHIGVFGSTDKENEEND